MLISLSVKNIALIDTTRIEFSNGLHVFTGETGAGKSLLIDSISLLLGGKSSKELIRAGEKRAFVEGVFSLTDCPAAVEYLASVEAAPEEDEITLSREITESGRSVCRVDGLTWQLSQYQELTQHLLDLHGQHAHQSLMDDKNHLGYLDQYGGEKHFRLVQDVQNAYTSWHDTALHLQKARKMNLEKEERIEFLKYQKKELAAAHLKAGEEEELQAERTLYRNAEKITGRLENAYDNIYGASPSATQLVKDASRSLKEIASFDERLSSLSERLENAFYELEDIGETLRDIHAGMPTDESRLDEVEERLDLIKRLSRKYGATTEEMLEKLAQIEEQLQNFSDIDGMIFDLEREEKKLRSIWEEAAEKLSKARLALSRVFSAEMEKQLADLNMGGTRFAVEFTACDISPLGKEKAAFVITANRGEKTQSLSKTASGGELSRLMLAIKTVGAGSSGIPTMIFDEIDTGISGRTAQAVAEKMKLLSASHQVLCVTHLQQIAALANHHYLIEKAFDGERTVSHAYEMDQEGRVGEVARMIGGDLESAKQHAREMIGIAKN